MCYTKHIVVDAEEIIGTLFAVTLDYYGCDHAVATIDSCQGLNILKCEPLDVTLLDMYMPIISGLAVLRQTTLACEALPVIITSHGSIETAVEPYKLEQEIAPGHSFSRTSN